MRLIVPLVAALVPLLITPGLVSHFDVTPKVAILLLGAALILLHRTANVQNVYNLVCHPAGRWLAGGLAAAWLSSVLATLFSTHAVLSLNGSNWRRLGLISYTGVLLFALLATAWLLADPGNLRTLLRACTASGALSAAYGVAQYFGWDPLLPVKAYEVGEGQLMIVRPPGTLGHADYFGAWLVTMVFLALGLERLETRPWLKRAALTASGLAAFALILSGTRSAVLGLLLGGIVFLVAGRARFRGRVVVPLLTAAVALVLFFFSPAGLKLRARLHWSLEDVRGGARLLLWRDSLRMAAVKPLSGFGPETFATEFPRFESADLASAFPDFYHESPHNMFLDTLASEGLAGLFVLLCLCALGAWCAVQCARFERPLAAPLAATLAGLLVAQQFIAFILPTALYFYLVLGMLVAIVIGDNKCEADTRFASLRLVAAVASIVMILVFMGYSARLLLADAAWASAQRSVAAADARSASDAYRSVLRWRLPGAGDDLQYSRAMQAVAANSRVLVTSLLARQQAMEAGFRAVETAEDRQNAWYNLAMLRAGNNDAAGVEDALRKAIGCAPNWFKPHWTLAQVLAMTGRHREALSEAQAAVQLDGGRDAEVTQTWKTLQGQADQRP